MSTVKFTIIFIFLNFFLSIPAMACSIDKGLSESEAPFLKVRSWCFDADNTTYVQAVKLPQDLWDLWKVRLNLSRWPVHFNRLTSDQADRMLVESSMILDIFSPLAYEITQGKKNPEKISSEATTIAKQLLQVKHPKTLKYFNALRELSTHNGKFIEPVIVALGVVDNLVREFMAMPLPVDESRGYFTDLERQLYGQHSRLPKLTDMESYKDAFQTMGIYGGLFDWTQEDNVQDIRQNFFSSSGLLGRPLDAHEAFVIMVFYHANNPYYSDSYSTKHMLQVLQRYMPALMAEVLTQTNSALTPVFEINSFEDFMLKKERWIALLNEPVGALRVLVQEQDTLHENASELISSEHLEEELWPKDTITPENVRFLDLRYQIILNKLSLLRRFVLVKSIDKLNDTIALLLEGEAEYEKICFTRLQGLFEATAFLHNEYGRMYTVIGKEHESFKHLNLKNDLHLIE